MFLSKPARYVFVILLIFFTEKIEFHCKSRRGHNENVVLFCVKENAKTGDCREIKTELLI